LHPTFPCQQQFKKLSSTVGNQQGSSDGRNANASQRYPLFKVNICRISSSNRLFVPDSKSGKSFLIDTGADVSVIPPKTINRDIKANNGVFDMKDMGLLKNCFGIEFEQNLERHEIKKHQQCYAKEVIKRFGMENSNTVSTPLAANEKLSKDMTSSDQEGSPEIKDLPYQSLIGSFMYLQ